MLWCWLVSHASLTHTSVLESSHLHHFVPSPSLSLLSLRYFEPVSTPPCSLSRTLSPLTLPYAFYFYIWCFLASSLHCLPTLPLLPSPETHILYSGHWLVATSSPLLPHGLQVAPPSPRSSPHPPTDVGHLQFLACPSTFPLIPDFVPGCPLQWPVVRVAVSLGRGGGRPAPQEGPSCINLFSLAPSPSLVFPAAYVSPSSLHFPSVFNFLSSYIPIFFRLHGSCFDLHTPYFITHFPPPIKCLFIW